MAHTLDDMTMRLTSALQELNHITEALNLMAGPGETPLEASIKWIIPKLGAVANELDSLDMATMGGVAGQGGAPYV